MNVVFLNAPEWIAEIERSKHMEGRRVVYLGIVTIPSGMHPILLRRVWLCGGFVGRSGDILLREHLGQCMDTPPSEEEAIWKRMKAAFQQTTETLERLGYEVRAGCPMEVFPR